MNACSRVFPLIQDESRPGEIFFAIKGDRFDGHDYIVDALGKGASGAVLEKILKLFNRVI